MNELNKIIVSQATKPIYRRKAEIVQPPKNEIYSTQNKSLDKQLSKLLFFK